MIAGGLGRGQQNFDRITSKDSEVRQAALEEIGRFFQTQADSYRNRSSSDARFVQFMMTASSHIEQTRRFKERFTDIAASMLTFYDSFDRWQNPRTRSRTRPTVPSGRPRRPVSAAVWPSHARRS